MQRTAYIKKWNIFLSTQTYFYVPIVFYLDKQNIGKILKNVYTHIPNLVLFSIIKEFHKDIKQLAYNST